MYGKLAILTILSFFIGTSIAASCTNPQIKSTSFTTSEGSVVSQIAFISEFTLKCGNSAENVALFAEVEGRIAPVARTADNRYQVSWTEDLKKASSGDRNVNIYDEDGYAAYRKAQRSNEDTSSIKPFAKVNVYHAGTYKGAWIKSELLATVVIGVAAYLAFSTRNKLIN